MIVESLKLSRLYKRKERDYRFVCELLRILYKRNTVRAPYLLPNNKRELSPHPDAILVFRSGILIIDSLSQSGHYTVNSKDNWSIKSKGGEELLPNRFIQCSEYREKTVEILKRNKIFCTKIKQLVILTADGATHNGMSDEVLTLGELFTYIKTFNKGRILTRKEMRTVIKELIAESEKNKSVKIL